MGWGRPGVLGHPAESASGDGSMGEGNVGVERKYLRDEEAGAPREGAGRWEYYLGSTLKSQGFRIWGKGLGFRIWVTIWIAVLGRKCQCPSTFVLHKKLLNTFLKFYLASAFLPCSEK